VHTQLQIRNSNGRCLKASNGCTYFFILIVHFLSEQMEIMLSVELGRLGEKSGFESSKLISWKRLLE
jgi:hypothetical protein